MAGRFVKIVIPFAILVIMTSQLVGCAATGGAQSADDVIAQDDSSIGVIGSKDEEKQPLSGDALIRYFQLTYDSYGTFKSASQEEQLNFELDMLVSFCDTAGEKLPVDYAEQYKSWRPADQQAPEVTLTFKDAYEVVFATGTVNTRSGPSTNDDKVGTLSRGDSATRIGIGTGDYEGWSLIQTQDWKIVYVSSDYLSTTKPSTGTTNNGTSTQGKPQGSTQQGKPQGGGQPSGDSGTIIDGGSSGVSSGSILSDPSKLTEGIDPNKDPWDTQYKPIYGGSGG